MNCASSVAIQLFLLHLGLTSVLGDKFLVFHSPYAASHPWHVLPVTREMLGRGHTITTIIFKAEHNFKFPDLGQNHTLIELAINNSNGDIGIFSKEERAHMVTSEVMAFDASPLKKLFTQDYNDFWKIMDATCDVILGNFTMVKWLKDEQFDVAVVDLFFGECGLALAHHTLGMPVIGFWAFPPSGILLDYTAAVSMPSYVPHHPSGLPDKMTFLQRAKNLALKAGWWLMTRYHFVRTDSIIRKYHPDLTTISSAYSEISGLLIDRMEMLVFPRPLPPNFVYMQGSGLSKNPPALPKTFSTFLDDAPHGVIIFSMGFSMKINMPIRLFSSFMKAFSEIPQRVVFQAFIHADDKRLVGVPPNVLLVEKIPQQSLLAHEKTILFITHCGTNSIIEGIFHKIPMVGMPIDFDQPDNMAFLKDKGAAGQISIWDDDTKILKTVKRVLKDPSYKAAVVQLAGLFAMARYKPLDNAVWLMEYVSKTKGAEHLKIESRKLNLLQYFCIDAIIFIMLAVSMLGYVSYKAVSQCLPQILRENLVPLGKIIFFAALSTYLTMVIHC